jgi:hypothetical protein
MTDRYLIEVHARLFSGGKGAACRAGLKSGTGLPDE